jgi:UDP-N-acetylmuramate--alanine ligase
LVIAFQPHLYSRTRAFAREFGVALVGADVVFVTGIYPAREAPIPGVSATLVVDAARQAGDPKRVRHVEDLKDLLDALRGELRDGDVFMTLGAGDIDGVAHALLSELGRSHVDA